MDKKDDNQKVVNIANVGNYTKNAVESFEENIMTQEDYLEKVKANEVPYFTDKYH